jgi:oxidase EvaA
MVAGGSIDFFVEMTTALGRWLDDCRRVCDMRVERIPRSRSREWIFDGRRLRHVTGAFFSVVGATIYRDGDRQHRFDQPLIHQPEIGILGFLVRPASHERELLIQAKPEPGNVGLLQAAPSVQATESNYGRRHHGRPTPCLEHFLPPPRGRVLADSMQSEQGTRFLGKYNRNVVVAVPPETPVPETPALKWCPISEVLPLLVEDFQVNTDARSIFASAPWRLLASAECPPFRRWRGRGGLGEALLSSYEAREEQQDLPTPRVIERLHRLRRTADFVTGVVGLAELHRWEITDLDIAPTDRSGFTVSHFCVSSSEREVADWDQPLITGPTDARMILLAQARKGVLHFLFAARPELGFRERFQYGPTVQDVPGDAPILPAVERQTRDLLSLADRAESALSVRQSDEGGRFFRCAARYGIHVLPEDTTIEPGDNLAWMTLGQIESLIPRPGFFSNEARSLISMLLAYA